MMEQVIVRGIAHDTNVAKMAMASVPDRPGIAAKLFKAVAAKNINIRLIVQGITTHGNKSDISFIVSKDNFEKVKKITEGLVDELGAEGVVYDEGVALVSIVGLGIANTPGVAADMFAILAAEGINIEMISTSEIKISCLIREEEVNKAVKALHHKFISAREE